MRLVWTTIFTASVLLSSVSVSVEDGGEETKTEERFINNGLRLANQVSQREEIRDSAVDTFNNQGNIRSGLSVRPLQYAHEKDGDGTGERSGELSRSDKSVGTDPDKSGKNRISVLSAGFRRMDSEELRRLDDPSMTDKVLDRFDDNNVENELNALATGFGNERQDLDVGHDNGNDDNYEGLGFGDTKFDHQLRRLETGHGQGEEDFRNPWSEWGHCNVTCGVGQQAKWRRCDSVPGAGRGTCNRVTGRENEWRRCLGMECDQKTIEELGGGCQDHFIMALVLGALIGLFGALIFSCLYSWCRQPSNWSVSDICPNCSGMCGDCCSYSPDSAPCCYGCSGLCYCCQPCCDPYYNSRNGPYKKHGTFYPHTYSIQAGRTTYKRPPAPLPRGASVKKNIYEDEPAYAEIDTFYRGSPEEKRRKPNSVKFAKATADYISLDEDETKRVHNQGENEYLEILADDNVDGDDDTYLTPLRRDEKPDFEYLRDPPPRPR